MGMESLAQHMEVRLAHFYSAIYNPSLWLNEGVKLNAGLIISLYTEVILFNRG